MNDPRRLLSTETSQIYPKSLLMSWNKRKVTEKLTTLHNLTVSNRTIEEESESSTAASSIYSHRHATKDTFRQHPSSPNQNQGFLHSIEILDGANQLLDMDCCGSSSTTLDENRFLSCRTDYYTEFVTAIPLKPCTATVTSTAFVRDNIRRYGFLKAIISGEDSSFRKD